MDESMRQEALLRHLLNGKTIKNDEKFVYSFLLGSRLFLSPHQLLTDLHRLSNDVEGQEIERPLAGKMCSKCREIHAKRQDVFSTEGASTLSELRSTSGTNNSINQRGTDFRSAAAKYRSSTYITINPVNGTLENAVTEGEETIRRRRRGRRRNLEESAQAPLVLDDPSINQESSRWSRDSGILSAVIDWELSDNTHHRRPVERVINDVNDSGLLVDDVNCDGCLQCNIISEREEPIGQKQQMVHVLHEWVKHFPADFRNKKMMWTLNDVIKSCQNVNDELSDMCTDVVDCISRRMAAQESYEQQLSDADDMGTLKKSQKYRKTRDWMVKHVLALKDATDVNEMAQQLCLIEMNLLKHVGAEEFLQMFTADGDEDVKTNLGACVRWFNRLSHLVGTVICMCHKRKHGRHVITLFSRVANRCFELSNFNSAMAILTGLSLGPVTRLKRTWNKLVLSELHKLQNVFDPTSNFQKYRSICSLRVGKLQISNAASSENKEETTNRYSIISQHSMTSVTSTSSQQGDSGIECDHDTAPTSDQKKRFSSEQTSVVSDGVMVPFLVLMVKDVYFLNHAMPNMDADGNINVEKLRNLANILSPLEEWKMMTSSYHKRDDMQDFLLHSPVQDDEDLYLLSYKREAPTNRFEKQQLKCLRTERDGKKKS